MADIHELSVRPSIAGKGLDDASALFAAAKSGNVQDFEFFMKKFTPTQIAELWDNDGWGPFHYVAMKGHIELAKLLIKYGVVIDCRDKFGSIPLYRAVGFGQDAMVYFLVEQGANPLYVNDAGDNMIHNSAWAGHVELTRFFLEKGVSPIAKNKANHIALLDMVKMIPDVADEWIATKAKIVNKYLLRVQTEYDFSGIDDMDPNSDDMTPLEHIIKKRNHDLISNKVIRKLLAWKWDVFAKKTFATEVFFYLGAVALLTYICISLVAFPNTVIYVYDSPSDYVRGVCELCFVGYAIFNFIAELRKLFNGGKDIIHVPKGPAGLLLRMFFPSAVDPALVKAKCVAVPRYVRSLQNLFELSTCIMVVLDGVIRAANIIGYKRHNENYISIQIEYNLLAIVCVLFWFKSLRLAALVTWTGPLIEIIKRMLGDVVLFLCIYLVFLMGFGLAFYLLLAPEVSAPIAAAGEDSFNGFQFTLLSTFLGLVGLWSTDAFFIANKSVAYVIFVAYVIVANICLLNLLIAMLSNTYGKVIYVSEKEFLILRAKYIVEVQKQLGKTIVRLLLENDLKSRKAEAITAENNTPDIEFVQTEKYSEWEKESEFEYKKEINLQLLRDDISKILHNQNLETTRLLENMANTIANLQAKIEKLDSK